MWLAFRRVAPPVFLGLMPAAILVMAMAKSAHDGNLGIDFRGEYYPEAKLVIHGTNPFPAPNADLSGGVNRVFPVPAALLVAPLTLLPVGAAAAVFVVLLLAALGATAWVLGVSDWRAYGMLALWPGSIAALQTGNLTILLGLLVAVAWRYRDHRHLPGIAIGTAIALKFFLWPLLVWLLALRRYRAAAEGAALGMASLLLVLPFTSLTDYVRLLDNLGNTFAHESYNLIGLLVQSGAVGLGPAKLVAYAVGLAVLALAWVRKSFVLAVAASLLLSPIVWLHYFVLLLLPLAAGRPKLSAAWVIPLALWASPGTGSQVREHHIVIGLVVLAAVTVLVEWGPARVGLPAGRRASGADGGAGAATPGEAGWGGM